MMTRCYPNIYRCIQCLPWHCQSVLILWHFDCSLDFFNFSLRGTQIHPKKPAFLRPIESLIFLKYMPRLHLLPSRISKFFKPPANQEGGLLPSPRSCLQHSGTCLWHVQSPPTSKNSPSTLKLFENPVTEIFLDAFLASTMV
jgi:hypothetical protein